MAVPIMMQIHDGNYAYYDAERSEFAYVFFPTKLVSGAGGSVLLSDVSVRFQIECQPDINGVAWNALGIRRSYRFYQSGAAFSLEALMASD